MFSIRGQGIEVQKLEQRPPTPQKKKPRESSTMQRTPISMYQLCSTILYYTVLYYAILRPSPCTNFACFWNTRLIQRAQRHVCSLPGFLKHPRRKFTCNDTCVLGSLSFKSRHAVARIILHVYTAKTPSEQTHEDKGASHKLRRCISE